MYIFDALTRNLIRRIRHAGKYFQDLFGVQKSVNEGKVHEKHFDIYLADKFQGTNLQYVTFPKYRDNSVLHDLLRRYKINSDPFQSYTKNRSNKLRKALKKALEKTKTPYDTWSRRGEGFSFLNTIVLPDGRKLGEELKRLQAKGAIKEEIKELLLSLKDTVIVNKNFMSTAIGKTADKYANAPVQWKIFIQKGTKGVYMEELMPASLVHEYEAELLIQMGKRLQIRNILFKNNQIFIIADIIK